MEFDFLYMRDKNQGSQKIPYQALQTNDCGLDKTRLGGLQWSRWDHPKKETLTPRAFPFLSIVSSRWFEEGNRPFESQCCDMT